VARAASIAVAERLEERRLLSAGDPDPSFGVGGVATADFGGAEAARAIAVQADGRTVAVGGRAMARFTAAWALDPTFSGDGKVTVPFEARAVAIDPATNKVYVAGVAAGADDFAVARYSGAGALDATFGTGGVVVTGFGAHEWGTCVAVQADGKVAVVARFNAGGSDDTTFSSPYFATFGGSALALQPDGKVLVGGYTMDFTNTVSVLRLRSDRTRDDTFGTDGLVRTDIPGAAAGLAVQPDGKVLVGGSSLARLRADGTFDSTFGAAGKVAAGRGPLALKSDGKVVTADTSDDGDIVLRRFNADGTVDTAFGAAAGHTTTDFGGTEVAEAVALGPDGGIVVAGTSTPDASWVTSDVVLARYVGDAPVGTPFNGTPFTIAGVVQAEDFDDGGPGVSYADTDVGNSGGRYRYTAVAVEARAGGGYNLGWVRAGEWTSYTVNAPVTGDYAFQFRVANPSAGGRFRLEVDGVDKTGLIAVPATGGWQTWQSVLKTAVHITAGRHTLRLVMDVNGSSGYVGNFDWFRVL